MSLSQKTEDTLSLDQVPMSLRKNNVSEEGVTKPLDDEKSLNEVNVRDDETRVNEPKSESQTENNNEGTDTKVSMKEAEPNTEMAELPFNEILKNTRLKAQLSLGDIVSGTRLPLKTIEKLEAGQIDQLPELVYTRAFVRTYAKHLELDANSIVANFHRVYEEQTGKKAGDSSEANLIDDTLRDNLLPQKTHSSGAKKWLCLLLLIVIVSGIYFYL